MITDERFYTEYDASVVDSLTASPDYEFVSRGATGLSTTIMVDPWAAPAWSGTFAAPDPGMRAMSGLCGTPSPTKLCVVARGLAFLGDVLAPEGFATIDSGGPVVSAVELPQDGVLLLLTPWEVTAIDHYGVRWRTERIAIEGLRVDEAVNGWVRGVADPRDLEPRDFAIELDSGRVVGGAGVA